MAKKQTSEKKGIVNIGTASMIVILIGLCFAVLAALAISSAKNDLELSENLANHVAEYYNACSAAWDQIEDETERASLFAARDDEGLSAFSIVIDGERALEVGLSFGEDADTYEIAYWQVGVTEEWISDETLPVLR